MADRGYVQTRHLRSWVPGWLWGIGKRWMPVARLLTVHDPDRCGCACHGYEFFDSRPVADRRRQFIDALKSIPAYLHANLHDLFGLVLDYLREEGEVRSITEMKHFFQRSYNIEGVDTACEWLSDEGSLSDALAGLVRGRSALDEQHADRRGSGRYAL